MNIRGFIFLSFWLVIFFDSARATLVAIYGTDMTRSLTGINCHNVAGYSKASWLPVIHFHPDASTENILTFIRAVRETD